MDRWNLYNLLKSESLNHISLATIEQSILNMEVKELQEGMIEYLYTRKRQENETKQSRIGASDNRLNVI
jgi:hypothetical protein